MIIRQWASSRMCPNKDEFSEIDPLRDPILITISNGNKVEAQGIGTVRVNLKTEEIIRI